MADPTDGQYSCAPELEDVVELCRQLNEASVRYVLIGGFAVILHGFVRGTKDIDLMAKACGVDFAEALRSGGLESFDLEGVEVPWPPRSS